MEKTNYSQLDQDLWILSKFDKDYKGFFIDIGAHDGISLSNSFLLEQNGWHGACVEPSVTEFEKLKNSRSCNTYNMCKGI